MPGNHWWARRELNSRSSPCQGDVITPRPRALHLKRIAAYIKPHRFFFQLTILDIFPLQPGIEHVPDILVLPLDILIREPSLIGPYFLHLRQ